MKTSTTRKIRHIRVLIGVNFSAYRHEISLIKRRQKVILESAKLNDW